MKPRAPKLTPPLLVGLAALLGILGSGLKASDTPPPLAEQTQAPAPSASPAVIRGTKRNAPVTNGTPKPVRTKQQKAIPFVLPIGEDANDFKIPELGMAGELLSQLMAAKVTRVDNEHVEMHEAKIDLYHPDGKEDFHVLMPDSIFNLQTHIINSDHPVTVRTQDFELTGERMQFNTVDRTGELQGHVHMVIHNLKHVAGVAQPTPAP